MRAGNYRFHKICFVTNFLDFILLYSPKYIYDLNFIEKIKYGQMGKI